MIGLPSPLYALRETYAPWTAPSALDGRGLRAWLRWTVPSAAIFGTVELVAGAVFLDMPAAPSAVLLLVFAGGVRYAQRLEQGLQAAVLATALLGLALALAFVRPISHAALGIVPLMAALLATAYGGRWAIPLLVACWATSFIVATTSVVGHEATHLPRWYDTGLVVAGQIVAATVTLALALHLHAGLRHVAAVARQREVEARSFFENSLDAVVTIDAAGRIADWNGEATAMFGWSADEVRGRSLTETIIPPAERQRHERGLRRARATGSGPLLNTRTRVEALRRDRTAVPVELAVVPMTVNGAPGYGGFLRDLSAELEAEKRLHDERSRRDTVAAALNSIRRAPTPEENARRLCEAVTKSTGLAVAGVYRLLPRGRAIALAVEAPPGAPVRGGVALPPQRAAYLRERASAGPWIEEWRGNGTTDYHTKWRDVGLTTTANVPIVGPSGVVAVLIVGSSEPVADAAVASLLASAIQFGAVANALLGDALELRAGEEEGRVRLGTVIARQAFEIVFQPVADLTTGRVAGYEALTRFEDKTRPDIRFAEAHALGLGIDLEVATLARSVARARGLPAGRWLGLNVSPEMLLQTQKMRSIFALADRPVVLEVAENVAIHDYAAVRAAVDALGPAATLAVDDAGAGYAGLRHLAELRPALVKLDIRLVRDVDVDAARQALIAGMVHFARSSDTAIVAEGIEREGERHTLAQLGVSLGQGYLLGRPVPVPVAVGLPSPVGAARTSRPNRAGLATVTGGLAGSRPRSQVMNATSSGEQA